MMKQPPIKYVGRDDTMAWSNLDTERMQVANHWNIANGHARKLESMLYRMWDDGKISNDVYYELRKECANACVGIHNLGQQLVKIQEYDYDFTKAEGLCSWENPDKTIYSHPIKTMKIVGK